MQRSENGFHAEKASLIRTCKDDLQDVLVIDCGEVLAVEFGQADRSGAAGTLADTAAEGSVRVPGGSESGAGLRHQAAELGVVFWLAAR